MDSVDHRHHNPVEAAHTAQGLEVGHTDTVAVGKVADRSAEAVDKLAAGKLAVDSFALGRAAGKAAAGKVAAGKAAAGIAVGMLDAAAVEHKSELGNPAQADMWATMAAAAVIHFWHCRRIPGHRLSHLMDSDSARGQSQAHCPSWPEPDRSP